jgi:hypothetical protein
VVPAVLEGNRLEGAVAALVGPGSVDAVPMPGAAAAAAGPNAEPGAAADVEPAAGAVFADLEAKLRFLKRLFEENLITEQEYTAKKAQLLKDM